MKLKIVKDAGIPLYLQIKEEIKKLIQSETLTPGTQLPTERELAEELGVSRNTVSMAFEELAAEGVLVIGRGKGTFVAGVEKKNPLLQELALTRKEKALRFIDLAIDECLDLGFSTEQFMALVTVRAKEKEESYQKARVLFIDCNQEQLQNFLYQFREYVRIDIIPVLLQDFISRSAKVQNLLKQIDLIATTTTHLDEVTRVVEEHGINVEVMPVAAQPKMESLIRLTRIKENQRVGLVCVSHEFPKIVERTLAKLGIYSVRFDFTTTENKTELEEYIQTHDLLLAFSDRYREVKAIAGEKEVIPYLHELDVGSVNLIRRGVERVMKLKRKDDRP